MLQLNFFREQRERVITGLKKRNWSDADVNNVLNEVSALDDTRRATQTELDGILAEGNRFSKQIGDLMKSGKHTEGGALKSKVAELKAKSKDLEEKLYQTVHKLDDVLISMPNIPNATVPFGVGADDNEVFQPWHLELPDLGAGSAAPGRPRCRRSPSRAAPGRRTRTHRDVATH